MELGTAPKAEGTAPTKPDVFREICVGGRLLGTTMVPSWPVNPAFPVVGECQTVLMATLWTSVPTELEGLQQRVGPSPREEGGGLSWASRDGEGRKLGDWQLPLVSSFLAHPTPYPSHSPQPPLLFPAGLLRVLQASQGPPFPGRPSVGSPDYTSGAAAHPCRQLLPLLW